MEIKKILKNTSKIAAWIVLPTVLVGGYFAVKYIIDYRQKKKISELRDKYKEINSIGDFYEGIKYLKQPVQFGYDLSKLSEKKEILDTIDFDKIKNYYALMSLIPAERTEEENQYILSFLNNLY